MFWGKNLENENFMAAAIHCENWYFKKTNIFHYFPSKNLKYSQIFLSETIHAQENGSRGPHFAKSLNSNFLKGLTYSAVCQASVSPDQISTFFQYIQAYKPFADHVPPNIKQYQLILTKYQPVSSYTDPVPSSTTYNSSFDESRTVYMV